MATPERLMGVGMEAEKAKRVGFFVQTVEAASTLNGPGNFSVRASTSATVNLGSNFDIGDIVVIAAVTTCSVSPGSTGNFGLTSAGVATLVSAGVAKVFMKLSSTTWWTVSSV